MTHTYYSQRKGTNPNQYGLPLADIVNLFIRVFDKFREDGYFNEAFGWECVDAGDIQGSVRDIELEILLTVGKKGLWPLHSNAILYSEDDFFDVIEFLHQHVSRPVDGHLHAYGNCGMHWDTFNRTQGQAAYREKVNAVLARYIGKFELSATGEVLQKAEAGFEQLLEADAPSKDRNITERITAAILRYRRHGSTLDDRRQAVRDLADVLEYLRPTVRSLLTTADEGDLFNLANNFGIRHHNDKQKTNYDASVWLSWMFYFYLATIHVVLRKRTQKAEQP